MADPDLRGLLESWIIHLRGDAWRDPWYAWTLVACATAVSVALNVAHAPERLGAQLFAALPPVALLGRWSF
jgi:hypothetical protein